MVTYISPGGGGTPREIVWGCAAILPYFRPEFITLERSKNAHKNRQKSSENFRPAAQTKFTGRANFARKKIMAFCANWPCQVLKV